MTAHGQKQDLPACCSYSAPVPADAASSGRAVHADTVLCFCGVSLLSPSVPRWVQSQPGVSQCELRVWASDTVFCFLSHNEPLLSYSLLGPASNLWPTNWQSHICLVLSWKVPVTLPPPPRHCSTLHRVQTRSQRSDLVTARCENRLPVGSGMLRATDWLLEMHMGSLLLRQLLVYLIEFPFYTAWTSQLASSLWLTACRNDFTLISFVTDRCW